jgi:adenine-specific DNA-methyltransferase
MTAQASPDYEDMARTATEALGFSIGSADIRALLELRVLPATSSKGQPTTIRISDLCRLGARVHTNVQIGGLFDETPGLFPDSHRNASNRVPIQRSSLAIEQPGVVFLGLAPTLGIAYNPGAVSASIVQVFITLVRLNRGRLGLCQAPKEVLSPFPVSLGPDATFWATETLDSSVLRSLWWQAVSIESATSFTESLATAKIYGNKARLTSFLVSVSALHLPQGSAICDLMSGTGIVSLRFADRYSVYSNDANLFAAHLTRCRAANISVSESAELLDKLRAPFDDNVDALQSTLREMLNVEANFLHGMVTDDTLNAYRAFCGRFPPPLLHESPASDLVASPTNDASTALQTMIHDRRSAAALFPYCLATAFYSNAYLGLQQAIVVDSIRYAIDQCAHGAARDLCLGALLLAVSSCGSGPHFAQPPKLHTTNAMAELVEHRARDVYAEFAMLFRLLSGDCPRPQRIRQVWNFDWRDALAAFDDATVADGTPRGVYVDPPYTKLQYSRYYHVLNTLLRYDYPVSEGIGRYPPRSQRFSSRFEYQPASASREFAELFDHCSQMGLTTMVSYSNRGLVPLGELVSLMEARFKVVEVYSTPLQHHSQGKPLSDASKALSEYALVGLP